jgi:predicted Zn-dependent protease with MMP-like domain
VPYKVSKSRFGELVQSALSELPEQFAQFVEEVPVEILDRPTAKQLRDSKVEPGGTLLGLYHGRKRTDRNVEDSGVLPDAIYIFQKPIESICQNEDDLRRQVRITVLHEIGHHFGLDEEELDRLGFG